MFQKAGFDVVNAQYNVGILKFRRAIREFEDLAADSDFAVVYYSGYGIDIHDINYLIPVDAELASNLDVDDEIIPLERLTKAIEGAKRLRLLILDACRDNPFARMMMRQRTPSTQTVNPGLGAPTTSTTLIAYAAKACSATEDGNGDHSPFTDALLTNLFVPGLDIRLAFGRIHNEVLKKTASRQEPFVYGSLGAGTIALVPVAVVPTPGVATDDLQRVKSDYSLVEEIGTKGAWEVFLTRHPTGFYSDLARQQIAKLNAGEPASTIDSTHRLVSIDVPRPPTPQGPSNEEQGAWDKIKDSGKEDDFRNFIKRYPTSVLANVAQSNIDAIERSAQEEAVKAQAAREASAEAQRQADAKRKADKATRQKAEQDAALAKAQQEARAAEQARQQAERESALKRDEQTQQKQLADAARVQQQAAVAAARQKADQEAAQKAQQEAARKKAEQEAALAKAQQETQAAEQARLRAQLAAAQNANAPAPQTPPTELPSANKEQTALPNFPWPPPAASASYVLPQSLFISQVTMGEETEAIIAALERNGYVERSFYGTPAPGVALITRLERINSDGSPASAAERWPAGEYQSDPVNLAQFLHGLFYAEPGRYRVIVFIIQDQPFTQAVDKVFSGEQAKALLPSGANVLPPMVAERPVKESHCTALIYEFSNDGAVMRKVESRLTGRQHLEKAGLLAALEKPN
jgi:hypothetical protein